MSLNTSHRKLTVKQQAAVNLVVQGLSDQEIADTVGVTRETVNRWRNGHSRFQAIINQQRQELFQPAQEQLRGLAGKAVTTLQQALEEGNVKAALEVLKAVKLLG